jgi:hypothetical protein
LREGLNATARIILLGLIMDAIYQIIVFKRFYPVEAVIIAVLPGFLPYLLFRVALRASFVAVPLHIKPEKVAQNGGFRLHSSAERFEVRVTSASHVSWIRTVSNAR